MIKIDDGRIQFMGNMVDLVSDLGMFWFAFELHPDWWHEMCKFVLPSLIETINMTDDQIDFLTELKALCDKHPHLFDKGRRNDSDVRIGKLKFEGGEK